ncbi:MAG: NAD+ synthase [Kiritimatiellae bacterium]|nr:NAD+ synthase [Kiritimatiellia bacterium]
MNRIVVALAQINPTVGALIPNADKVVRFAEEAARQGAVLAVFPEMCIAGYPPEDLVQKPHFIEDCGVEIARLAARLPREIVVIVGAPQRGDDPAEGRPYNAAFVFHGGFVRGIARKSALAAYGVYDERRLFSAGRRPTVLRIGRSAIGIHICQDSWNTAAPPCQTMRGGRLDLLVNLSASPFHRGRSRQRVAILRAAASAVDAPVMMANLVGGQDELVFDGASFAVEPTGRVLAQARPFAEDLLLLEVPARYRAEDVVFAECDLVDIAAAPTGEVSQRPPPRLERWPEGPEEVYRALSLGLRDYMDKNGFQRCVVALSGGIDSALVATIAADALGPERVVGVTMPSRHTSAETRTDAERVARNLGIEFREVDIDGLFGAFLEQLSAQWSGRRPDVTEENLQARIRAVVLMALSNKFGWLALSCGNKSELATGYCTLYGDMSGGYTLLKDVTKTLVYELARWRNGRGGPPPIPDTVLTRPPTAELRPGQRDEDTLPPYSILDPILELYVEQDLSFDRIVARGFPPETVRRVIRMVDAAEYKRRQGAPGVKITPKAFGRDRCMPITNLYRERT